MGTVGGWEGTSVRRRAPASWSAHEMKPGRKFRVRTHKVCTHAQDGRSPNSGWPCSVQIRVTHVKLVLSRGARCTHIHECFKDEFTHFVLFSHM